MINPFICNFAGILAFDENKIDTLKKNFSFNAWFSKDFFLDRIRKNVYM